MHILILFFLLSSIKIFAFDSFEHFIMNEKHQLFYPYDLKTSENIYPYKNEISELNKIFDTTDLKSEKIDKENFTKNMLIIGERNKIPISFGEIAAIAGDYIALNNTDNKTDIFKRIISIRCAENDDSCNDDIKKRFKKAVGYFLKFDTYPYDVFPGWSDKKYNFFSMMTYIRENIIRPELNALKNALSKVGKKDLHLFFLNQGKAVRTMWDNGVSYGKYGGTSAYYQQILAENIDHFEEDAKIVYRIGHSLALENAFASGKAYKSGDKKNALELLNEAYVTEAFSFHYLTDLFSAGHIRTPRRAIFEEMSTNLTPMVKGIIANAMHDEDGYFGLSVINSLQDRWIAYGDESYFAQKSRNNREQINLALNNSLEEIKNAFNSALNDDTKLSEFMKANAMKSFRYIPRVFGEGLDDLMQSFTIQDVNINPLVNQRGTLIRDPREIHSTVYKPLTTYHTLLSWATSNPNKISSYTDYLLSDNIIFEINNNKLVKYNTLSIFCYEKEKYNKIDQKMSV